MTTKIGPPIAVGTAILYCREKHEITLITDGTTAYAYGPKVEAWVSRDVAGDYEVNCREVVGHWGDGMEEPCRNEVFVSPEKLVWVSDPEVIAMLVKWGKEIER